MREVGRKGSADGELCPEVPDVCVPLTRGNTESRSRRTVRRGEGERHAGASNSLRDSDRGTRPGWVPASVVMPTRFLVYANRSCESQVFHLAKHAMRNVSINLRKEKKNKIRSDERAETSALKGKRKKGNRKEDSKKKEKKNKTMVRSKRDTCTF